MEEKEQGITLGEIVHVIFIKKWLLLAVTVVIMLLSVLFVQVFYNPGKVEYQATFEVRYPNMDTKRYPDGTEFLYKEFISLDNLKRAQEKSESFSSINVELMKKSNNITIRENEITVNNEPVKTGTYTIFISKRFFSSPEQAVDFFRELISIPVEDIIEKSKLLNYDRYLKQFNMVGDYSTQLDRLIDQKNLIIESYDKMIETYSNGHSIVLDNGKTRNLVDELSEVEGYFSFYSLESMKKEVEMNGYVKKDSDFIDSIEKEISNLNREKEKNNAMITKLHEQVNDLKEDLVGTVTVTDAAFQEIFSEITTLTKRNVEIDHLIDTVYAVYLKGHETPDYNKNLEAFEKRLMDHYSKLQEFTDHYALFNNEIYETNSKVLVSAGSIITQSGGINILIVLVASLVAGFVLSCCLNLVLDLPKYLKSKKGKETNLEKSSSEESLVSKEQK